jgi:hypothetical protein
VFIETICDVVLCVCVCIWLPCLGREDFVSWSVGGVGSLDVEFLAVAPGGLDGLGSSLRTSRCGDARNNIICDSTAMDALHDMRVRT